MRKETIVFESHIIIKNVIKGLVCDMIEVIGKLH